METNITRRRAVQGIGAIGVAGIVGNTVVSTSEGVGAVQEDQAALRVAHTSPDAPTVEVRADPVETADTETGTETDTGTGTETDTGTGTETDTGTGTETGTQTGTEDGEDGPLIEDLGFGEVSDYQAVDPGTYQVQVVATEQTGLIEEIFGPGGDQEQVVYDDELALEAGTTYTAVVFGELAQTDGVGGGETPAGETPTDGTTPTDGEGTPVGGETPTDDEGTPGGETPTEGEETPGEETPTDGETPTDSDEVLVDQLAYGDSDSFEVEAGEYTLEFRESEAAVTGMSDESERGFRVEILEDDLSAPGEGTTAGEDGTPTPGSPTDEADTPTGEETPADEGTPTDGTETPVGGGTPTDEGTPMGEGTPEAGETPGGTELSRMRVFHAVPDVGAITIVAVEDEGGPFGGEDGAENNQTETTAQDGTVVETTAQDGTVVETTAQDGTVVETTAQDGTDDGEGENGVEAADVSLEGGTVYSGFAIGYFDPEAAAGGEETPAGETPTEETPTAEGTATDGGATPAGSPTTAGEDGGVTSGGRAEEFQLVTVETSTDGERADGGTDGGILPNASALQKQSD